MELVIKIPEEYYKAIKEIPVEQSSIDMLIIRYGTPLPKGRGRLIDADAFQLYCFYKNFEGSLSDKGLAIINAFLTFQRSIIEADKAESEE